MRSDLLPIILSIFVAIFAVAVLVLTAGMGKAKRVNLRLAALDREYAPAEPREGITDIRKSERPLSGIPLLNRWLTSMNLASASILFFYQAGITMNLGTLLLISVASSAAVGCLLYLRFGATLAMLLLSAGCLPLPLLYVRRRRTKRLSKLEQQLPEALGMMVSALRVGHSLIASLGAVADESSEPISGEMRKCFEQQNYGLDLRTALVNLTERAPIQDFRIFVAAVLIQKESGGNLAEVLEKVAQTTRERFRLKKQVAVHTAQGRMTGWILSLLPLVLGLGMYFVNPDSMSVLWTRPIGWKILCGAMGMDVAGGLIIRKIVAIRV
jgi:tight adherence protein B